MILNREFENNSKLIANFIFRSFIPNINLLLLKIGDFYMQINSIQNYHNNSSSSFKGITIPRDRRDISSRLSEYDKACLRRSDTSGAMIHIMQAFCDKAESYVMARLSEKDRGKLAILIRNAIRNQAKAILERTNNPKASDFELRVGRYTWTETKWSGCRDACGAYYEPYQYSYTEKSDDRFAFRNRNFPIPFIVKGSKCDFDKNLDNTEERYYKDDIIDDFQIMLYPNLYGFRGCYITLEDNKGNPSRELFVQKLIEENEELNKILANRKTIKASDVKNVSEVAPIYPYYDDLKDEFKKIEIDNI